MADMLIKSRDAVNIVFGNTFSDEYHTHKKFDYVRSLFLTIVRVTLTHSLQRE